MMQIISHLPTWVIGLFFLVIYLGYGQTKTREVSRVRLTVLPLVMLGLSLYNVLQVPNSLALALTAWAAGLALTFWINSRLPHGAGVVAHPSNDSFIVPGSWIPMMLLITVFAARFAFGYLAGSHIVDSHSLGFIVLSSAVSGLISGTFSARAAQIFATGRTSAKMLAIQMERA